MHHKLILLQIIFTNYFNLSCFWKFCDLFFIWLIDVLSKRKSFNPLFLWTTHFPHTLLFYLKKVIKIYWKVAYISNFNSDWNMFTVLYMWVPYHFVAVMFLASLSFTKLILLLTPFPTWYCYYFESQPVAACKMLHIEKACSIVL